MYYVPQPDIIERPSLAMKEMLELDRVPKGLTKALSVTPEARPSSQILMDLLNVYIKNNREVGRAEIYLCTVVVDSLGTDPFVTKVSEFTGIKDRQALPIDPENGLTLYRSNKVPDFLDYRILVAESDEDVRNAGEVIADLVNTDQYKSFRDAILGVTAFGQPQIALISAAADFLVNTISKILKMNKDDQLIYVAGSFDRQFDQPRPVVKVSNDYVNLYYSIKIAENL